MTYQNKTEEYWKKTLNPKKREDSYYNNKKNYVSNLLIKQISRLDPKPKSILDVGCGYGYDLEKLSNYFPDIKFTGFDIFEDCINFCKTKIKNKNVSFYCRRIEKLNKNEHFDLIYTSGVLIHQSPEKIEDYIDILKNMANHYIIHIEDFGVNELISGPKEDKPSWRISNQYLWKHDLLNIYLKYNSNFFVNILQEDAVNIGIRYFLLIDLNRTINYQWKDIYNNWNKINL